jgi:peptidoglycan/LPS O-acetylase OafA/YrhL
MPNINSEDASAPRIPSLDGLRALSIAAVILGHASGTGRFPEWLNRIFRNELFDIANLGVRVFFVISGFLITGLLQAEHKKHGDISLGQFFFRRTFRIVPAYLFFVGVVFALSMFGVTAVTSRDLTHVLTYTTNYYAGRSWDIGHLWSLAVEEQFYLLWPPTISMLGFLTGRRLLFGLAAIVPLIRVLQSMVFPELRPLIGNSFETTADALAMGCLLALMQEKLWTHEKVRKLLASPWCAPVLLAVGTLASLRYRPSLLIGTPITNLAVMMFVARAVRLPDSLLGRSLNLPVLVYCGTLSYSLYLWQQIFLNRASSQWWTTFPQNMVLTFLTAIVSHYVVERPFLSWRGILEARLFSRRTVKISQ